MITQKDITFRRIATEKDVPIVRKIMQSSKFFDQAPDEIDNAIGDLLHGMQMPPESDEYLFLFAEKDGETVGFGCYGKAPCTVASYYAYWLAVSQNLRGGGIGKMMMSEIERDVRERGGKKLYLQTAGRPQYIPTQKFYEKYGFILEAVLKDYYTEGDSCFFYTKNLD